MSKSKQPSRRRLNETDYELVKKALDKGATINAARQTTGLGASTLRRIKKSKNYKSYLAISRKDSTNAQQRALMAQGHSAKEAKAMLTAAQPKAGNHVDEPNDIIDESRAFHETDENGNSVPVAELPPESDESKAESDFEREWRESNAKPQIDLADVAKEFDHTTATGTYGVGFDPAFIEPKLSRDDKIMLAVVVVVVLMALIGMGWLVGQLFSIIF